MQSSNYRSETLSTNRQLRKLPVVSSDTKSIGRRTGPNVVPRVKSDENPVMKGSKTPTVVRRKDKQLPPPPTDVVPTIPGQSICVFPIEFIRRLDNIESNNKTLNKEIKEAIEKAKKVEKRNEKLEKLYKSKKEKSRNPVQYSQSHRSNKETQTATSDDQNNRIIREIIKFSSDESTNKSDYSVDSQGRDVLDGLDNVSSNDFDESSVDNKHISRSDRAKINSMLELRARLENDIVSACSLPISRSELLDYVKNTERQVIYYGYPAIFGRDTILVSYNTETGIASQYTLKYTQIEEQDDDTRELSQLAEYFGVTWVDKLCPNMGCYVSGMELDVFTEYDLLKRRKKCFSCTGLAEGDICVRNIVISRFDRDVNKLIDEYNSYNNLYNAIRLYMFALLKSGLVQTDPVFTDVFQKGIATKILKNEEPEWHTIDCCDDAPELAIEWYDQAILLLSWTRTLLSNNI